ncbi:ATP-binding protein [Streptomyces longispororuber]|uniref:ATP-binding protein n=1 Tax=Streptomyces longispororuber TaxID=68230 RepID=UPI00210CB9C0|nr:ATP-binding protein [Streptomyces longispororuber]MCQ4209521.1 ATP-binding protein [Streptomyces longispororuber]
MIQQNCVFRKPWGLAFMAEPSEVAGLRRVMRLHLRYWGLHHLVDAAQTCVTELVANVIAHVGPGTPTELALSMNGTYLRIEVQDPDLRALPTLLDAAADAESGRGMKLVDAVAHSWGVLLKAERKVVWCELATGLRFPGGHVTDDRVDRTEALLRLYRGAGEATRANSQLGKTAAVAMVADLLRWACAHGYDPDEVLDSAQGSFEAEELTC